MNSKIIKLSTQNVKRLSAVEIEPDGNLVVIGGNNGNGKSSVLDSIMYALSGTKSHPQQPVRAGQDNASIVVELSDLIIKRTFTAAGGTSLTVTNKEGAKYPSPQAILDKLVGTLSFDPLEFARNTGNQAETLRKLVGLDFSAQDDYAKVLYDERTGINREVKSLLAQVQAAPEFLDVGDAEVSTAEILKEQQAAAAVNQKNALARSEAQRKAADSRSIEAAHATLLNKVGEKKAALAKLQNEIAAYEAEATASAEAVKAKKAEVTQAQSAAAALVDIDLSPFAARAGQVEEINRKVRSNKARAILAAQLEAKRKKSDALTAKIDGIDAAKTKAISEAKYPIPGLSFDKDGNVLFGGIPFSQASSADQTKVSISIGLALNPTLRVLLIRDGSLLDEKSLAIVADIAAKNDAQVWMERVSTGGEVSVIIEDGMVAK